MVDNATKTNTASSAAGSKANNASASSSTAAASNNSTKNPNHGHQSKNAQKKKGKGNKNKQTNHATTTQNSKPIGAAHQANEKFDAFNADHYKQKLEQGIDAALAFLEMLQQAVGNQSIMQLLRQQQEAVYCLLCVIGWLCSIPALFHFVDVLSYADGYGDSYMLTKLYTAVFWKPNFLSSISATVLVLCLAKFCDFFSKLVYKINNFANLAAPPKPTQQPAHTNYQVMLQLQRLHRVFTLVMGTVACWFIGGGGFAGAIGGTGAAIAWVNEHTYDVYKVYLLSDRHMSSSGLVTVVNLLYLSMFVLPCQQLYSPCGMIKYAVRKVSFVLVRTMLWEYGIWKPTRWSVVVWCGCMELVRLVRTKNKARDPALQLAIVYFTLWLRGGEFPGLIFLATWLFTAMFIFNSYGQIIGKPTLADALEGSPLLTPLAVSYIVPYMWHLHQSLSSAAAAETIRYLWLQRIGLYTGPFITLYVARKFPWMSYAVYNHPDSFIWLVTSIILFTLGFGAAAEALHLFNSYNAFKQFLRFEWVKLQNLKFWQWGLWKYFKWGWVEGGDSYKKWGRFDNDDYTDEFPSFNFGSSSAFHRKKNPKSSAEDTLDIPEMMPPLPIPPNCPPHIASILQATDHFAVLGLSLSADEASIRKQKRQLSLATHPDKNKDIPGADEACKRVLEAADVLLDTKQREEYEELIELERMSGEEKVEATIGKIYEETGIDITQFGNSVLVPCGSCHIGVHQCYLTKIPPKNARKCDRCFSRHAVYDKEMWMEVKKKVFSSYVELVGYVCDGDKVYEATELFECMGLIKMWEDYKITENRCDNPLMRRTVHVRGERTASGSSSRPGGGGGGKGRRRRR